MAFLYNFLAFLCSPWEVIQWRGLSPRVHLTLRSVKNFVKLTPKLPPEAQMWLLSMGTCVSDMHMHPIWTRLSMEINVGNYFWNAIQILDQSPWNCICHVAVRLLLDIRMIPKAIDIMSFISILHYVKVCCFLLSRLYQFICEKIKAQWERWLVKRAYSGRKRFLTELRITFCWICFWISSFNLFNRK